MSHFDSAHPRQRLQVVDQCAHLFRRIEDRFQTVAPLLVKISEQRGPKVV
jgi:hypothetical protein